ncbi:MAG TPA: response regulator [Labilithrix sp.]|nr:response regulator [Labilithrix sp.]
MRALIVDDSRSIRVIIGRFLRELGFETLEAANGREALDVLSAAEKVDLALVDWNMPVMDGYQLVCELRRNPSRDDMRILMVTTETEIDRVSTALEAGASEYLMKPFTKDAIAGKLAILGLVEA